jgi:hypothetical protein
MDDKGLALFSDKSLGNRYMTLILECIITWGTKHPQTTTKSPTKFKIAQNKLLSAKVVLPTKFIYFGSNESKVKPRQEERGGSSGQSGSTPQGGKEDLSL